MATVTSMSGFALLLLLVAAPSTPAAPEALVLFETQDPGTGWLLVRGEPEQYRGLTWQRIGDAYLTQLGAEWQVVGADRAHERPETNRFVIGTASSNKLIAELADELGLEWTARGLHHPGGEIGPGTGLVIVCDDPDGGGLLTVFTGADEDGVYTCFTTNVRILEKGRRVIRPPGADFDTAEPRVVRLDQDFEYLRGSLPDAGPNDQALRIARGLFGYDDVISRAWGTQGDPYRRTLLLLTDMRRDLDRARSFFAGRDLTAEILDARRRATDLLGRRDGPQPVYYVLYGPPRGTNAQTFDPDPLTGRQRVLFNLTALARGRHFESAVAHETVHTLQQLGGRRLVERAVTEGVASLLAQELAPDLSDVDALLWTDAELSAAEKRRDAIVAAVLALADSTDESEQAPFMTLGLQPAAIPGAPSRTAYWVAWLAARAWREAHPGSTAADLLSASPDDVFAALE